MLLFAHHCAVSCGLGMLQLPGLLRVSSTGACCSARGRCLWHMGEAGTVLTIGLIGKIISDSDMNEIEVGQMPAN